MRTREDIRAALEIVDGEIFESLVRRLDLSREMAGVKYPEGDSTCDPGREEEMIMEMVSKYEGVISPSIVRRVYRALIQSGKGVEYLRRRELVYSGANGSIRD
ncbi:MAG: chorismate mutase [Nanoarchaeota archaeon]|nr:chorismate mutase [Nanoarchaeota archaeon]